MHDTFQAVGTNTYGWLTTMTEAKEVAHPFNIDLQTLAYTSRPKLNKIYLRTSQGIQLPESPYVTLKPVSEVNMDDCNDLDESAKKLRSELADLVIKLNPPAKVFSSTPTSHI